MNEGVERKGIECNEQQLVYKLKANQIKPEVRKFIVTEEGLGRDKMSELLKRFFIW